MIFFGFFVVVYVAEVALSVIYFREKKSKDQTIKDE